MKGRHLNHLGTQQELTRDTMASGGGRSDRERPPLWLVQSACITPSSPSPPGLSLHQARCSPGGDRGDRALGQGFPGPVTSLFSSLSVPDKPRSRHTAPRAVRAK